MRPALDADGLILKWADGNRRTAESRRRVICGSSKAPFCAARTSSTRMFSPRVSKMAPMTWSRPVAVLVCWALALQAGCATTRGRPPVSDRAGRPISEEEIRHEMRPVTGPIGWGILFGGALGMVVGSQIGYRIGHAWDTARGCEDCGLGGLVGGAVVGVLGGVVGGALLVYESAQARERRAAIRRIQARRSTEGAASRGGDLYPLQLGCDSTEPPVPSSTEAFAHAETPLAVNGSGRGRVAGLNLPVGAMAGWSPQCQLQ